MRVIINIILIISIICAVQVDAQFWKYPQEFLSTWIRQGKTGDTSYPSSTPLPSSPTSIPIINSSKVTTLLSSSSSSSSSIGNLTTNSPQTTRSLPRTSSSTIKSEKKTTKIKISTSGTTSPSLSPSTTSTTTATSRKANATISTMKTTKKHILTSSATEASTFTETTTHDVTATTEEPRENHRTHEFYLSKREKPQVKIASNISQNLLPLPAGASAALVKPTKYHYYPHNQHIYLLPECAIQQVCNAVYVRLNWTQPLCACPSRYRDPCSASLNSDDQHTTELMTDRKSKRALTLVKTCEPTTEMRVCRSPRDWSLLALQNIRTGKSHYLVICRCPDVSILEGPMSHDQPTYASVPGIRVYGMMCVDGGAKRRGRPLARNERSLLIDDDLENNPPFPWDKAIELAKTAQWD